MFQVGVVVEHLYVPGCSRVFHGIPEHFDARAFCYQAGCTSGFAGPLVNKAIMEPIRTLV